MYFGNAIELSPEGSLPIKVQRIAEIIKDLDPTLELAWIPPDKRSAFDKHPFAVVHRPADGRPPYVAMTMAEDEVDHRIISKLIRRDTHRGSLIDDLEAEEAAARLVEAKKQLEEMEEAREFAEWAIKSKKTVKHNGWKFR